MKRVAAIVLTLLILLFLFLFTRFIPGVYSGIAKTYYLNKNYVEAYKNFKISLRLNPRDIDTRYYFAQSLLKLKPDLRVQEELYNLSQMNIPDSADLIAKRQISKWQSQILANYFGSYIEQAPFNGQILRWDAKTFPLKVYFQNDSQTSVPQYYYDSINNAFLQWQKASRSLVKFATVNNLKDAQIIVKFIPVSQAGKCNQQDCKYVVAYTMPDIEGDMLKKMEIIFYSTDNLGNPFSSKAIYNTSVHEIGHALGIMGHSYNERDIMYMQTGIENKFSDLRSDFQSISTGDIKTLELLYKIVPQITNTAKNEYDVSGQFFAPIILGSNKQINSRKILEAKNYIKQAPNLPNGYIDLSAAYAQEKEYTLAVQSLDDALKMASSDSEKFVIYYNYAILYMNMKDFDSALEYAQKAKQIQGSDDIDGLIAAINFNKGNKDFAKKMYIESFEKNPSNILDAVNLARIYLREFNFVQAGKTLNKLIETNPQAKSDSRLKPFAVIIFLFK